MDFDFRVNRRDEPLLLSQRMGLSKSFVKVCRTSASVKLLLLPIIDDISSDRQTSCHEQGIAGKLPTSSVGSQSGPTPSQRRFCQSFVDGKGQRTPVIIAQTVDGCVLRHLAGGD